MRNFVKFATLFLGLIPCLSLALPIGFGRNQGDLNYTELKSPNFFIYHDERAPHEALLVLESLEAAKPKLEAWLGVNRKDRLKVILSSTTANASFANFITDAIELQTMARGGRDLAWHEYVHSSMYRHLDNIFGPAGSIVHLPWMPAWWIEGLAEALAISSGSDLQYGIERHFALNGNWPSYDKLHALYDGSNFSTIGYAISGAFVNYLLRSNDSTQLPSVLNAFYSYSMPWYWPLSVVPFADFMPMDAALRQLNSKNGADSYKEYQKSATAYWTSRSDLLNFTYKANKLELKLPKEPAQISPTKHGLPGELVNFASNYSIQSRGNDLFQLRRSGSELAEYKIKFKDELAESLEKNWVLPEDALASRLHRQDLSIYLTAEKLPNLAPKQSVWMLKNGKKIRLFQRKSIINNIMLAADKLIWLEEFLEQQKICWAPRSHLTNSLKIAAGDIHCPITATYPTQLTILGHQSLSDAVGEDLVTEIWLNRSEETLLGDRHQLQRWTPSDGKLQNLTMPLRGKPISIAFNNQGSWLALADRTHHFLRKLDPDGQCMAEVDLANIITHLYNSSNDSLTLSLWQEDSYLLIKTNLLQKSMRACKSHDEPSSPILRSMLDSNKSLKEILVASSPWQISTEVQHKADQEKIAQASSLGVLANTNTASLSRPIAWRGRPVFAFPWIGYDALGLSYGLISVPLMDHLQNESAQLTALYGAASRYPDIQLNLSSTRFDTSFGLAFFRKQTWNGVFGPKVYYFDERGAELSASRFIRSLGIGLNLAYKNSWLLPYLGDADIWQASAPNGNYALTRGFLREFSIGLNKQHSFYWASLSYYLNSSIAAKLFNGNYDYEQTGGGINLSIPLSLWNQPSTQSWGASYSRVRGERRKLLKEAYRPLHTYVPGSGGGLNSTNAPLYGPGLLTSAQYADTQGRLQFSWTTPLVADIAKLIHIVYLQRLDVTAFVNFGRAWAQQIHPTLNSAQLAHGYKLDLQADIKGVKLNIGLGTGQVAQQKWEVFGLFGFDALIDQDQR